MSSLDMKEVSVTVLSNDVSDGGCLCKYDSMFFFFLRAVDVAVMADDGDPRNEAAWLCLRSSGSATVSLGAASCTSLKMCVQIDSLLLPSALPPRLLSGGELLWR